MAKKTTKAETAASAENKSLGELVDASEFVVLGNNGSALSALAYNIAGESIDEFDLDRVRVPAGGLTVFETPEGEAVKTIDGIMISVGIRRAYWSKPFGDGGNVPPDCSSTDGLVGIGEPGGNCAHCPFNQFGSAFKQDGSQGRGKRCRESRAIFVIRAEDRLPLVITAPATSLKNTKKYLMSLPVRRTQAITRFSLVKDKSADGVEYAKIVLTYVGRIEERFAEPLLQYANALGGVLTARAPSALDYSGHSAVGNLNSPDESAVAEMMNVDDIPPDAAEDDGDYDVEPSDE